MHGIKLATILEELFKEYGWEELGDILNIKAFLFTVSLFSFINLQPDSLMSWIYLFYFPVITAAWFSFVSYALTHEALGDIFDQYNPKIQFASSAFILALGLLIFLQTIYGIL